MAIIRHSGPRDGLQVISRELARRSHAVHQLLPLGGSPQASSPLPVYQLTLEQAAQANCLDGATNTGWYYPIIGGAAPGLAQVREKPTGSVYEGLTQGPLPTRIVAASYLADQRLGTAAETYEPRILFVHALHIAALWLHGASDLLIPLLEGQPPGSAPLRLVSDASGMIREAAAKRREPSLRGGRGPSN